MGELIEHRIHLDEGREKVDMRESRKAKLRKPAQVRTEAGGKQGNIKGSAREPVSNVQFTDSLNQFTELCNHHHNPI